MFRSALLLIRSSLPSMLVLTASLVLISNILADAPEDAGTDQAGAMPLIAPLIHRPPGAGAGSAIGQNAIFDPGRRPETIGGSIDDLRNSGAAPPATAPVSIAGTLLSGSQRKAMLAVGSGAPAWSSVGADVGGWRVAVIDDAGAVLERDGQSLALKVADRYKLRSKPDVASGRPAGPPGFPEAAPGAPEVPFPGMPGAP